MSEFSKDKLIDKVSQNYNDQIDKKLFKLSNINTDISEKTAFENYSYWHSTFIAFIHNKVAVVIMLVLLAVLLFACIQPFLPNQIDPNKVNLDPTTSLQIVNQGPGKGFIIGTNSIGQDLWARIWSGTRTSLILGVIVALVNVSIGIIVGAIWGYVKRLEGPLTAVYNVLSNIPTIIIQILMAYILRPGVSTIIIAMCVTGWLGVALFIRNQIIIIRDREYNLASKCLGTPTKKIITKNLLPFLISVIVMEFALQVPAAIGSELILSFVGLGLPNDIPSLGNLVNEGRIIMMSPTLRYQLIYPAILTGLITISFYIIGNAFADSSDPKNHR